MLDTPSNNFAVLSSIDKSNTTASILTNWGLRQANTSSAHGSNIATIRSEENMKIYFEYTAELDAWPYTVHYFDFRYDEDNRLSLYFNNYHNGTVWTRSNWVRTDIMSSPYVYDQDIIQVAYDWTTWKVWYWINNTWYDWSGGTTWNPSTWANPLAVLDKTLSYAVNAMNYMRSWTFNFGQGWRSGLTYYSDAGGKFKYAPPTGFKALSTANLPTPTIKDPSKHFDVVTYTGNGTDWNTITWLGFKPDFVWIKWRSVAQNNSLYDTVRGVEKRLCSNATDDEYTGPIFLRSFNNNGFTLWTENEINQASQTYVAWNWKAGWTAVSNTDWSITSQVSANPAAGFSIVGYTGNWSYSTIWHGLNKNPEMVIIKNRTDSSDWIVWQDYLHNDPWDDRHLKLNTTGSFNGTLSTWGTPSKPPTWTIINLGTDNTVNGNGDNIIAYAFHSVPGYSKVWSYTGNGSVDGPFVYTGFKPAYIMVKKSDSVDEWVIIDVKRTGTYTPRVLANRSNAETDDVSVLFDFNSNWFKIRDTQNMTNASWWKYIYIAFADAPFKYATAR